MPQTEILKPVSILNNQGGPQNFGWSRQPDFFYDPALVWASRRRHSDFDRYIVFTPSHLVTLEIKDEGYKGVTGISVISLKDKKRSTQLFHSVLPMGSYELPPESQTGAIKFRHKKSTLDFIPRDGGIRIIRADFPRFGRHRSLRGELVLTEPASAESLCTNISWPQGKNAFRYSRRSPWFTVEGVIQFGTTEIIFTRGKSWGIYDWSRGVRPRSEVHYWACGCGMAGERLIGFCVGYGSGDSSMGTENAFFVDGKLHKLDQVTFNIPPVNWLSPWRFTSNDNRLEMIFTPHQERIDRSRMLMFSCTRRQVCGFFSGKAVLDDGSSMEFQNITGFAERYKTNF